MEEDTDIIMDRQTGDGTSVEEVSRMIPVSDSFSTLVVMEFSSETKSATMEWLLAKIQAPQRDGGAALQAHPVVNKDNKESIIHIGATTERLLMAAELMELKKLYLDGSLREISLADLDNFQNSETIKTFLTTAEKQRIILHELENIRALSTDKHIAGYPKHTLYSSQSIIRQCLKEDVVTRFYPLHDQQELKKLGQGWYNAVIKIQPLARIRTYFGETIAMYFAFLGLYTMALIPPAFIGIMSAIFSWDNIKLQLFFSIFNLVWVTVFLEGWKRHCATLAYSWGTINSNKFEEARAEYYGKMSVNKVTGRHEPRYPKWKRMLKYYCVSLPVIAVWLYAAFEVMLLYFWLERWAQRKHKEEKGYASQVLMFLPTVIYAVVIAIMNGIYRKVARLLNDWENHRLQRAYNNHLIFKLVVFDFVNCFMSLFYVAFYMQDMVLLRSHLAALLITQAVIGQIRETIVPFFFFHRRAKQKITKQKRDFDIKELNPMTMLKEDFVSENVQNEAEIESAMDVYEGILDDYLEMFLQFGYVFLFSSVFPSAAFWALLNNITEIRTDAFKFCRIFQRPFSEPTADIGAWQVAFEVMSIVAVFTNCSLVYLTPQVQSHVPDVGGPVQMVLLFVVAEHIILMIKRALDFMIPDAPEWVEVALARLEYQSKQAWRKEKSLAVKKNLSKRLHKKEDQSDPTDLMEQKNK